MTNTLIIAITAVWVFAIVAGVLNPKYQVPEQVNALFTAVVGGLLINNGFGRRNGGDDDDERD